LEYAIKRGVHDGFHIRKENQIHLKEQFREPNGKKKLAALMGKRERAGGDDIVLPHGDGTKYGAQKQQQLPGGIGRK